MKTNPIKKKLREGKPSFGTWLSLGHSHATRVLARLGFDWLTLDMEHSPYDWSHAATIFALIAEAGCVPICRVPEGNHTYIKLALEAGAWGIVVPMVNTVEQAKLAIAAAKYPPEGNRSVGGGLHALNFDATPEDYFRRANDEILIVLQTESPQGIANAEEIYRLPGVDAIFVGPADLRAQLRKPGGPEVDDATHERAIQQVIAIGKQAKLPTGMHVMSPQVALERAAQGMQFLAVESDLMAMTERAQEILKLLNPSRAAKDVARY